MSKHPFEEWLQTNRTEIGRHSLLLLTESEGTRAAVLKRLRGLIRGHYLDPKVTARRLASLGAPKTAALLRELTPTNKRARSGDLGEILATEVAEQLLDYTIPIRRLRWKDGREMALRGDDIIGVSPKKNKLRMLKGESKSRAALSTAVLEEAGIALDRDQGRPTRHSVLFTAARLSDQGQDELAEELEQAVLHSFRGVPVEHMLFVLTGGPPGDLLSAHLTSKAKNRQVRHAVGIRINDHGAFVDLVFKGF